MRLVWHIVKKDLRRMGLPVGLWLLFVAAIAIWFRSVSAPEGGEISGAAYTWLPMMTLWIRYLTVAKFVIGYLLTGAVVIEDTPVGTTEFWMTRPLAGARMLAAKFLAVASMFVVAPALVLSITWAGMGFTLSQTGSAAWEFGLSAAGVALFAFGVAALAATLAQFLFCSIGLLIAFSAFSMLAVLLSEPASAALFQSRELIAGIAIAVAWAMVVAQQFITRRRARAWGTVCFALFAGLTIRVMWPWDVLSRQNSRLAGLPQNDSVKISTERLSLGLYGQKKLEANRRLQASLWLTASPAMADDGLWFVPVNGVGVLHAPGQPDDEIPFDLINGLDGEAVIPKLLGRPAAPVSWMLYGRSGHAVASAEGEAGVAGAVEVWLTKPRILGELAQQFGAEFSNGANRLRVVAFEWPLSFAGAVVIEERDVQRGDTGVWVRDDKKLSVLDGTRIDAFVLLNRAAGRAEVIQPEELGSVSMDSQTIGYRRFYIREAQGGDDWRREAVIVKVRFERQGSFQSRFEANAPIVTHEQ